MLLALADGGIENILTDEEYSPGCPTCDYGSQYINEVEVKLTKYTVRASFNKMYSYFLSSGDLMQLFLCNVNSIQRMTESEFTEWLRQSLTQRVNEVSRWDEIIFDFEVIDKTNLS